MTTGTVEAIARIFDPEQREQISGVVGSYEVTRQAIEFDTRRALAVLAVISLSLAIVNLFPFLPLDGGHIFWSVVEKVRGRPVPFRVMEQSGYIGFMLVIFLFVDRALERHRAADRGGIRHQIGAGLCSGRGLDRGGEQWNAPLSTRRRDLTRPRSRRPSSIPRGCTRTGSRSAPVAGSRRSPGREYGEQVDRFALGLRELGLKRGDVFALMLTNRPEFHIADTAAMSLGATPFSLYQTLTPDQIAYQLNDSGAEIVVTEPAFLEQRAGGARSRRPACGT